MNSGKQPLSLVFFGSGPLGLATLKALHEVFTIEAVVTKPNPSSSKIPRLVPDFAATHNIKLMQPANKAELAEQVAAAQFTSSLGVVVDYGIIIPQPVIASFGLGIVNSHFSLLPEWRGADPITFSLLSGQPKTGVSLMLIVPQLDAGDLLIQQPYTLAPNETIHTLSQALTDISNQLLINTLPQYAAGTLHTYPQDTQNNAITYSRKLTKADGEIDWHKPALQLEREIRAFLGWPGSKTTLAGKRVTICQATAVRSATGTPGTATADANKAISIACGEGALRITQLKPDGKGLMSAQAFLAGNQLTT